VHRQLRHLASFSAGPARDGPVAAAATRAGYCLKPRSCGDRHGARIPLGGLRIVRSEHSWPRVLRLLAAFSVCEAKVPDLTSSGFHLRTGCVRPCRLRPTPGTCCMTMGASVTRHASPSQPAHRSHGAMRPEDPPLLGAGTRRDGREEPGQDARTITIPKLASEAHDLGLISHLSGHRGDVDEAWPDLGMDHRPASRRELWHADLEGPDGARVFEAGGMTQTWHRNAREGLASHGATAEQLPCGVRAVSAGPEDRFDLAPLGRSDLFSFEPVRNAIAAAAGCRPRMEHGVR
jgi:hypothetical protein